MEKTELFVYNEMDDETPKQSPQSNQTWPMDKIHRSRFQLQSPVTPKSLLIQCLTDPLPRSRRFLASSCSDEEILMDGVLVTSATPMKLVSDSSIIKRNEETTLSEKSSAETFSPESPPRQATPFPHHHYYNPQFPWANSHSSLNLHPFPFMYRPRSPFLYQAYQRTLLLPFPPHEDKSPPRNLPANNPWRQNTLLPPRVSTPPTANPSTTTIPPPSDALETVTEKYELGFPLPTKEKDRKKLKRNAHILPPARRVEESTSFAKILGNAINESPKKKTQSSTITYTLGTMSTLENKVKGRGKIFVAGDPSPFSSYEKQRSI